MVKAQERSARCPGAGVHLRTSRRSFTDDQPDLPAILQLPQDLRRLHGGHHPLGNLRVEREAAYQIGDKMIIVPYRDNQADQWTDHALTRPSSYAAVTSELSEGS